MKETFNLALIYGSAREDRFCDTVADWAIKILKTDPDLSVDIIDPAKLDLPSRHVGNAHPGVAELQSVLAEADAFLVVTPEYNHSFTGELKLLIDAAKPEWCRKPLAFVSYGGMSGGLRAVEQLRLVFAELHVVTMRDVVSFANVWDQFDQNGYPIDKAGSEAALKHMVNDLKWWARTLREGRYPQVRAEMPEVTIS
ncbi:NADPH-dependent FMN reductase [Thalassospira xiamenensis]|uniref:NADPH-dependent FMN reductase n=1 Tax=Thalassospira xiamenensis TaxID=220697 RepID=UPI000DEDA7B5|nr:NAD(P)H-dependent oxidoreductase [Thalassospira xiamenensis]RCK41568.1 FMN reductase [Thalassospira xiamenensis]